MKLEIELQATERIYTEEQEALIVIQLAPIILNPKEHKQLLEKTTGHKITCSVQPKNKEKQ